MLSYRLHSIVFSVCTVQIMVRLWLKWPNITVYRNIYQSTTVSKMCSDLPLFWVLEFSMILEFFEIITFKFARNFLMELELMELEYHKNLQNCSMEELEYHGKLEFPKLE